ncbi:MAG: hypothetical protein PHX51_02105 [Clostridia bacterium]|nr:hypothetical protein [Clostridia bacterium]
MIERLEQFLQANWEQRSVFYMDNVVTSRQQFINFDVSGGIKTNNYIGTICYEGETLNIFPKVYKLDEDDDETDTWNTDDLIHNLVNWLNYCEKLEYPFITIDSALSSTTNLFELLVTIFAHYVKRALDIAPYRCYEDTAEVGQLVKGKIDFNQYVTRQIPTGNWHKVPYVYSNFVFDNKLNRIIKSTCKMLFNATTEKSSKELLRNLLLRLGDVSDENCMPSDCDRIRLSKLHKRYIILLSLCKMFLLNRTSTYEMGSSQSYCFLFPAELLFEGFVGGFVKEMLEGEAKVKCQASDQYLADLVVDGELIGQAFNLKEDILIETADAVIVLDTKYKEIDHFDRIKTDLNRKLGISDADMKQMAVYAVKRNAKKLFLLYPLYRQEELESVSVVYNIKWDEQDSRKTVPLEILKIPFVFDSDDGVTIEKLKSVLEKITA